MILQAAVDHLRDLHVTAGTRNIPHVLFVDADLSPDPTALAVGPSDMWPLFSSYPLVGREVSMA